MRTLLAALALLSLVACSTEDAAPKERLTFDRTETVAELAEGSSTRRPAEGNVFVIVHLTEDPAPTERRGWMGTVVEDWDGRTHTPRSLFVGGSTTSTNGPFGREKTVSTDKISIVFEMPRTATLRTLTLPHRIPVSPVTPLRIRKPENAPRVVRRVEPYYPESARRANVTGLVKFDVLITAEGKVGGARHIHGPKILADAAAAAIRQWDYEPAVVDGKPVPALIQVQINFALGKPSVSS
ncbi:MAG: energy transducer TonB [Thermoanaerobaculia bacterium]